MKEQFVKVLVACAAISTFGVGAYVGTSAVTQVIDSRVTAILSQDASSDTTAATQADGVAQTIKGLKKLLNK